MIRLLSKPLDELAVRTLNEQLQPARWETRNVEEMGQVGQENHFQPEHPQIWELLSWLKYHFNVSWDLIKMLLRNLLVGLVLMNMVTFISDSSRIFSVVEQKG